MTARLSKGKGDVMPTSFLIARPAPGTRAPRPRSDTLVRHPRLRPAPVIARARLPPVRGAVTVSCDH